MFLKYKCLIILLLFLTGNMMTEAQELIAPTDTVMAVVGDTIVPAGQDSVFALDSVPKKQTGLDAPVSYQAKDSIIMTGANWAYLFGESDVKYQQIELQSEKIEMNMDSSLVYATFGLDSIGEEFGYPLFKDGDQQYESKTMRYNFGTKKGYITDVITQQGEGYVTAGRTKKMDNDVLNMVGGTLYDLRRARSSPLLYPDDEGESPSEEEYRDRACLYGVRGCPALSDRPAFLFLPVFKFLFFGYYHAYFRG